MAADDDGDGDGGGGGGGGKHVGHSVSIHVLVQVRHTVLYNL